LVEENCRLQDEVAELRRELEGNGEDDSER
jgi:hypothetical protein